MLSYLTKKFISVLATLLVASFVVFALTEMTPGSVARKKLGQFALQSQVDFMDEQLGYNDPFYVRYSRWLGILVGAIPDPIQDPKVGEALGRSFVDSRGNQYFGNFGFSFQSNQPVNDIIWKKLKNTAILAGVSFALIVPISIFFGMLAGMREGSWYDRTISIGGIIATSLPEFALGVFLVAIFSTGLGWLPGGSPLSEGGGGSIPIQFVMPVMVLVIYDSGYVIRMVRGSMTEVMASNYIRTAILKGMKMPRVVARHGLRNAMIAPFTVMMLQLNFLISGVVVTEMIFNFPGFGQLLLKASLEKDVQMIEAATLISLVFAILTQFISDIGYALLNPRIGLR
ncbi:MAG: ABC transporter permease [Alphaproteobacteria bacterium]|nr:ABC transporter permease [Alphaproteobacteria bacterium]